jgi:hypothetical protein
MERLLMARTTKKKRSAIVRKVHLPFGQADCESEVKMLKADYSQLYFDETPFNSAAIQPETYLIIGRRGSGKTALSQYFSFQEIIQNPIYIDVDEPAVYQQVLSDIATHASESREIAIPRLKKVWEYVIWCVIFEHTRKNSPVIERACDESCSTGRVGHLINTIIDRLLISLKETDEKRIDARIHQLLNDDRIEAARREVLKVTEERPIIIAIDTLEKYDVGNAALMNAMAALIQCGADFNLDFSNKDVHLKVFMSGEVFPYLEEAIIQNPLKSIKDPVYLLWRPKDLLRLISWRLFNYLDQNDMLRYESKSSTRWDNYSEVLEKMWTPYFGRTITNVRGHKEHSFPYVLRHTQMRPRQLILLCNAIAKRAQKNGRFPTFSEDDIRLGVRDAESYLASEILNSFSSVYENVGTIVDALMKMPMVFSGNELDKRASQSASEWPTGAYSPARFRRLVAELGIVGRVRRHNPDAGYIDADFEYSIRERLPLTHRDECVVHPMFYSRLNVEFNTDSRVMPFSSEHNE